MSELRRRYCKIVLYGILVVTILYVFVPWLRKPLIRENNILELLQVILYLTTALWGIRELAKGKLEQARWTLGLIILFSLLFVLEELSYGDTFLPIYESLGERAPRIYGVKIDALHDLIQVLYLAIRTKISSFWITVWGIVVAGLCLYGSIAWRLYDLNTIQGVFRQNPPLEFICLCILLLMLSTLIDLEILRHHYLVLLEEILETLASLALLFSLFSLQNQALLVSKH